MTIKQALLLFPKIEADLLLAEVLGKSKEFLYIHSEQELAPIELAQFKELAEKRTTGTPIAYLQGYKDFYGLRFSVTSDVLIPRPETEWLVEKSLKIIDKSQEKIKVLDVGTGSGCIAISIAKSAAKNNAAVTAVDISPAALEVAMQNAAIHKVAINFSHSDLFKTVVGTFDIIIANLPYVPLSDYTELEENLKHEPSSAITTNDETWDIYTRFFEQVSTHITPSGTILLEIDPKQKSKLSEEIKKWIPNAQITFERDIHKLWRYCLVTRVYER